MIVWPGRLDGARALIISGVRRSGLRQRGDRADQKPRLPARPRLRSVGMPDLRRARSAAQGAAALAFASAAVTLYWTAGGTLLLDTVGGAIEDLAHDRSLGAVAPGTATVSLKVAAAILALALVHVLGGGRRRRFLLLANGTA